MALAMATRCCSPPDKRKKMWKIIGPILALVIVAGIGAGIYYIPILTNQAASENSDVDMDELMELLMYLESFQ